MAHEDIIKEVKKAALKENIPPKETEDYLLKKGLDEKEAKHASEQINAAQILENAKKAEKEKKLIQREQKAGLQPANEKKSGFGFYVIILLAIAAIIFLFYYGIIPGDIFKMVNFK